MIVWLFVLSYIFGFIVTLGAVIPAWSLHWAFILYDDNRKMQVDYLFCIWLAAFWPIAILMAKFSEPKLVYGWCLWPRPYWLHYVRKARKEFNAQFEYCRPKVYKNWHFWATKRNELVE